MRIALFSECYRPIVNGVVVSVSTFAGELRKLGHEVHIIAPAYPGYRDDEPNVHRLPSICLPTTPRYPLAIPYTGGRLRPVFEQHLPDIIHAQHPFTTGREGRRWARRLKRPLVFTYHTLIRQYAHYIPLPQPLVRAAAVRVSRGFSNSADHVIVPTESVGELLRSYGVHRPITAIPTGVDLDLIRRRPGLPRRESMGIPRDVPLIAYSGRIALEKNLELLVRAVGRLVHAGSDVHAILIGGGPWEGECRRLLRTEGISDRVHMPGFLPREDLFDWLAEADLFCFTSLTDTQGVAVLEAMALGCPPVAVRSGAVEDVIRDGIDGVLVDADLEAWSHSQRTLVGDSARRRELAGGARLRTEDGTAGRMAQKLTHVYEQLLGG